VLFIDSAYTLAGFGSNVEISDSVRKNCFILVVKIVGLNNAENLQKWE
jgi:hypothetical protein